MNLQNIIDYRTRFLQFDLDDAYGDSGVTAAQQVESVNWAVRAISRRIQQYSPRIVLTLTAGTSDYNLRDTAVVSKKVIKPVSVVVNGNPLRNCRSDEYGPWSMAELDRESSSWRTDAGGTPTKWVQYTNGRLLLHPTPTASNVSGGNNFVSGTYMAADLTSVGDLTLVTPDLPEELHEAVAFFAAAHSALPNVSEQEGWQRLAAYNAEWQAAVEDVKRENLRLQQAFGSTGGWETADYI